MKVPQLLGYARIAGMPLVDGLHTALLAPVGFALFNWRSLDADRRISGVFGRQFSPQSPCRRS